MGLDPTEVALKNDGYEGHDAEWLLGAKRRWGKPGRDSLAECIEAGKKAIGWDQKWHLPGARRLPNGKMHGMGFGWTHEWNSKRGAGTAGLLIQPDGSVSILAQRADVGVVAETAYCQIAADELGMRYEDVTLKQQMDTGFAMMTPDGSCNLCTNGHVVRRAARKAKQALLEFAANGYDGGDATTHPAFPGYKPEDLDIRESVIFVKADQSVRKTVRDVVREVQCVQWWKHPQIYAYAWKQSGAWTDATGAAAEGLVDYTERPHFCRQAHFMEVEVDTETGEIDIVKLVIVNDVGKAINPEAVEGQQYGGAFMAVSRAQTEELVWDLNTGVMLNGNLLDYKILDHPRLRAHRDDHHRNRNGLRTLRGQWHWRGRRRPRGLAFGTRGPQCDRDCGRRFSHYPRQGPESAGKAAGGAMRSFARVNAAAIMWKSLTP